MGVTIKPKRKKSNIKYGSRASRGKRPTSAQARESGSNMKKKPKKGGSNRTVGQVVKSMHKALRKKPVKSKPKARKTSTQKYGKRKKG